MIGSEFTHQVLKDVASERNRQVTVKGYDLEHDRSMVGSNELIWAGVSYALSATGEAYGQEFALEEYPWGNAEDVLGDKLSTYEKLIRAAALLMAEAELVAQEKSSVQRVVQDLPMTISNATPPTLAESYAAVGDAEMRRRLIDATFSSSPLFEQMKPRRDDRPSAWPMNNPEPEAA